MLFWFGLVLCHFYRQDCQHFAAFLSWTYSVHNLGVLLDSNLTMVPHVNSVTKTCFYYLALISRIRKFLDRESTKSLVHALVISRLDYANSLLYGLPNSVLKKLQRVQNSKSSTDSVEFSAGGAEDRNGARAVQGETKALLIQFVVTS